MPDSNEIPWSKFPVDPTKGDNGSNSQKMGQPGIASVGITRIVRSGSGENAAGTPLTEFPMESLIPFKKDRAIPDWITGKTMRGSASQEDPVADAELKERLEAERENAFRMGMVEGEAQARMEYLASIDGLEAKIGDALGRISMEKAEVFSGFEDNALSLIMVCVRKVFDGISLFQPDAILPVVKKAVSALEVGSSLVIRVNPSDFKLVNENRSFWLSAGKEIRDIRIIEDDSIIRTSCSAETDAACIHMNLEAILVLMEEEMKKLNRERPEPEQHRMEDQGP